MANTKNGKIYQTQHIQFDGYLNGMFVKSMTHPKPNASNFIDESLHDMNCNVCHTKSEMSFDCCIFSDKLAGVITWNMFIIFIEQRNRFELNAVLIR